MKAQKRVAVQMGIDQAYKRHTSVFAGIHDYSRTQGEWRLIVDEWADDTLPGRGTKPSPYEGLIGRISRKGAFRAKRLEIPAVNVWYNSPIRELPGVFPDYAAGGRLRAEHLLARGFQNFGTIYRASYRASVVEAEAFAQVVQEAGCEHYSHVIEKGPDTSVKGQEETYRDWQRQIQTYERWLETVPLPIGLFIYRVDTARVIIEMCRNRGWRVPEDVAIIAGSNEETICERPEPGITSLEWPYEEIGYQAAELLNRLMKSRQTQQNSETHPEIILLPPVGIVARRSTDFHAVDDELVRQVLRYIDENLHRRITLDQIADAVHVSRRTLTDRFRIGLNRTVAEEIQRLRIERVKRELMATTLSIQQIAGKAGFNSLRTLNDAFLKLVGCSPRDYRKRRAALKTAHQNEINVGG